MFSICLTDRGNLTPEERQYAELLIVLIQKFEERYRLPVETTPLDAVRFFMDQHDLKQSDMLDVFGSKGIASEVLGGKRRLSKTHIERLSEKFHVSPATFFERSKRRKTA
jgi:HTH-type transcriptional regulator / antitoxin HigA